MIARSRFLVGSIVTALVLAGYVAEAKGSTHWNDTEIISRQGRFLFDTLFGLNTAAFSLDDDDDLTNNQVKSCDCGKYRRNSFPAGP